MHRQAQGLGRRDTGIMLQRVARYWYQQFAYVVEEKCYFASCLLFPLFQMADVKDHVIDIKSKKKKKYMYICIHNKKYTEVLLTTQILIPYYFEVISFSDHHDKRPIWKLSTHTHLFQNRTCVFAQVEHFLMFISFNPELLIVIPVISSHYHGII